MPGRLRPHTLRAGQPPLRGRADPASFDALVDDLRAGALSETVPRHGTLVRVRRSVGLAADRAAIVAERAQAAEAAAARAAATGSGEKKA